MIFSEQLLFSDQQAITVDAVSDNVIDLSALSPLITSRIDIGVGILIPILIQVVAGFDTSANTLIVSLEHSDTEGSGYEKIVSTIAKPTSEMTEAGFQFPINHFVRNMDKRFLRIDYNVSANLVGGKITAGIVMSAQGNFS